MVKHIVRNTDNPEILIS